MLKDPFATLGVSSSASVREIRAAFRRQALRHHPDHNPGDPSAATRFKRVLRAYRSALARHRRMPSEPPVGPRPDRYVCGCCGDRFPFAETCARCGVALWDRTSGPPPADDRPEVRAMMDRLEARPMVTGPTWEERLPVPGLLVAACLAGALFAYQVGPVGVALLLAGFATYVTALELHRRATEPSLGQRA